MKLYIPDPQKWVDFFDRVSAGKISLNQTGRGRRHSIIPVVSTTSETDKVVPIKAVLPAEQTTAQAKSKLGRQDINPSEIVDMYQSTTRSRRKGTKRKRISQKSNKGKKTETC